MKYTKQPLTFAEQADLLIQRGFIADREELIHTLEHVNYYRLSGYLYPFRNSDHETFKPGTTLHKVWRRYTFDRRLRLLLMDAIERFEISVRTLLAYHFSHQYGAFGHTRQANLPKLEPVEYAKWLDQLKTETKRSHEIFVNHFLLKYDEHEHLPLWMLCEVMSFGSTLTFFKGISPEIKRKIAAHYQIPDVVLWSWLRSLNAVRNLCAHHGRLIGRELGYKPLIPNARKYLEWHDPVNFNNNRLFVTITICQYLMRLIVPQSHWAHLLIDLLEEYSEIPLEPLGFPENWQQCPIWIAID